MMVESGSESVGVEAAEVAQAAIEGAVGKSGFLACARSSTRAVNFGGGARLGSL